MSGQAIALGQGADSTTAASSLSAILYDERTVVSTNDVHLIRAKNAADMLPMKCNELCAMFKAKTLLIMLKPLTVVLQLGPVMTVGEALAMKPGDTPPKFEETMYYPSPKAVLDRCQEILGKHEKETKNEEQNNKAKGDWGEAR